MSGGLIQYLNDGLIPRQFKPTRTIWDDLLGMAEIYLRRVEHTLVNLTRL